MQSNNSLGLNKFQVTSNNKRHSKQPKQRADLWEDSSSESNFSNSVSICCKSNASKSTDESIETSSTDTFKKSSLPTESSEENSVTSSKVSVQSPEELKLRNLIALRRKRIKVSFCIIVIYIW